MVPFWFRAFICSSRLHVCITFLCFLSIMMTGTENKEIKDAALALKELSV